jgi:acyl dehydratase
MTAIGAGVLRAVAVTSSRPVPTGCTVRARVTLTLSGSSGMNMTWTPVEHPRLVGAATLAGS